MAAGLKRIKDDALKPVIEYENSENASATAFNSLTYLDF